MTIFHRWVPGPPLSEHVDFVWISEGYVQPHGREHVLPTGTLELVFALASDGVPRDAVVGPRTRAIVLDTSQPLGVMGVHFRPGGGAAFLTMPSTELQNRSASVVDVWGNRQALLGERLWQARSAAARFRLIERALLDQFRERHRRHPATSFALAAFEASEGRARVADVLNRVGLSHRRFIELFRREIGLTPKEFSRLRRFDAALRRLECVNDVEWSALALSCGYYDQAHFIHDFREFAGVTPTVYLANRTSRRHVAVKGS